MQKKIGLVSRIKTKERTPLFEVQTRNDFPNHPVLAAEILTFHPNKHSLG